jgi:hypothetical protein
MLPLPLLEHFSIAVKGTVCLFIYALFKSFVSRADYVTSSGMLLLNDK